MSQDKLSFFQEKKLEAFIEIIMNFFQKIVFRTKPEV